MPPPEKKRQKNTPTHLSIFDRIEFGVISAFFGLLIGGLIALVVVGLSYIVLGEGRSYNTWLVWFSVGYFFLVGALRGAEAAETIVDGLAATAAVVLGGFGAVGSGQPYDTDMQWRSSV